MPNPDILTEIPPISGQDCFVVFDRYKREFCFPVHIHKEYELNLVCGARGATRIVGDSVREISDKDLVLITGSYLEHAWLNGNFSRNADIHEICVQFSPNLFESGFIDRKQFYPIKKMFEYARRGIAFSEETVSRVEPIIENLIRSGDRFDSVLNFLMLLNCLARESDYHILAQRSVSIENNVNYDMPRIQKVMQYLNDNFHRDISVAEVKALVNMSDPVGGGFAHADRKPDQKHFGDRLQMRIQQPFELQPDIQEGKGFDSQCVQDVLHPEENIRINST